MRGLFRFLVPAHEVKRRAQETVSRREETEAGTRAETLDGLAANMRTRESRKQVLIGWAKDSRRERFPLLVGAEEFVRRGSVLQVGSTGGGKTYALLGWLRSFLRAGIPCLVVDGKGELAELLTTVVAAECADLDEPAREALLQRVRVIDPFAEGFGVAWDVLASDPAISPEIQARDVASVFERTTSPIGVRQELLLGRLLELAIEQGVALPHCVHLLQDPNLLAAVARRSPREDLRRYFTEIVENDSETTRIGLLARFMTWASVPAVRRMLAARGTIRFGELLRSGITIVNIGSVPSGAEEFVRSLGNLVVTRLIRSVLAREYVPGTSPSLVIMDEFQEALSPGLADSLERTLRLARAKQVFFWLATQTRASVTKVSPTLDKILLANCDVMCFRAGVEDARLIEPLLGATGCVRRERSVKGRSAYLDPAEERAWRADGIPSLPDRRFYYCHRRQGGWLTPLLKSADFPLEALRERAAALPSAVRLRVERGAIARPAIELEAEVAAREAALLACASAATDVGTHLDEAPPSKRGKSARRKGDAEWLG